jgi:murein DD-endopeptidase MepM/ murein hydrolase activator NlpD
MARQRTKIDRKRALALASLIAIGMFASACTPERPAYVVDPEHADYPYTEEHHYTVTVHEGDTVSSIASRCDTDSDKIVDLNDLDDPQSIHPGQVLRVPSGQCHEWVDDARPKPRPYRDRALREDAYYVVPRPRPDRYDSQQTSHHDVDDHSTENSWLSWWTDGGYDKTQDSDTTRFIWPVRGSVIESFGRGRHGEGNDGINIASEDGAPIRAAASGVVTYTGNEIRGYGNLVLIKHDGGYVTAYAHAGSIRVSRGDRVEKGQVIATVGETGDVDRPQLHFEIRRGVQAVDPQRFLADRAS